MSDTSLRERPGMYPGSSSRQIHEKSPARLPMALPRLGTNRPLTALPFDIILNIIEYLDVDDLTNLEGTCKFLHDFIQSRPIWRSLAMESFRACRPLPLRGFQRIQNLSMPDLAKLVRRGRKLNDSWTKSNPKLIRTYIRIPSPRDEDIVWLSPITSKYALCCTKTGKVICWDTDSGKCPATWSSGADWEIWKCRVEFDQRTVYFAMAKRNENGIGTDCQLMALYFPEDEQQSPCFTKLLNLCFPGQVISIYLLDPSRRLLSAYIWLQNQNHLGLFVLLDWADPNYVFLDTGIVCDPRLDLTCLSHDPENLVIHVEEEARAYQFFYPLNLLRSVATPTPPLPREADPPLILPLRTVSLDFIPTTNPFEGVYAAQSSHFVRQWWQMGPYSSRILRRSSTIVLKSFIVPDPGPNDPPRRPSDPPPGTHLFTIAQHYFMVPLRQETLRWWHVSKPFEIVCHPSFNAAHPPEPFEEVAIPLPAFVLDGLEALAQEGGTLHGGDANEEQNENAELPPLPIPPPAPPAEEPDDLTVYPLVAVEFGMAAWLEYESFATDRIRLRYIVFPTVDVDRTADDFDGLSRESDVHTLDVPPEVDLRSVAHIGLDQAHGTVILGMRRRHIYVLRYE